MNISGNLDLVDYKLKRLGNCTENTDAVNKGQLDKAIYYKSFNRNKKRRIRRSINKSCTKRKFFLRVMDNDDDEDDDDICKVGSIDKDYHTINHKTYLFYIDYDSSIGYYSTRLSIDLVYLPIGYYTMAFELYFLDKIYPNTVSIDGRSGTLSQIKTTSKKVK